MKRIYTLLVFLTVFISAANSQKTLRVNENKYRINLYDYWGKSHPVMKNLIEKLPLICEELKDKELCGDGCNPGYTVEFYISEPNIIGYNKEKLPPTPPSTNTRSLLLRVPSRALLLGQRPEEFPMPDNTPENWAIYTEFSFQCFLLLRDKNDKIITKMVLVDTNETWETLFKPRFNQANDQLYNGPDSFIEHYKDKLAPPMGELLLIAEQKMLGL